MNIKRKQERKIKGKKIENKRMQRKEQRFMNS